ncbi:MAG: hypothetical protein JWP89_377 [Schlesneria sp.]|nr:hypothetical protein [Schlesneria sp.]
MTQSHTITKIGLVVIRERRLLVVRKDGSPWYILPGGRPEPNENDTMTLEREITEELSARLDVTSVSFIGTFSDRAANEPDSIVEIRLYNGEIQGLLLPANEIVEYRWLDPADALLREQLAPSIANQILPYLLTANLL